MNKKGFSLTEVIIATSILSITVFGVYKLIGENTKIINNSGEHFQANSLFNSLEECLMNTPQTSLGANLYYFNFGNNLKECNYSETQNSTEIDGNNYILKIERTDSGLTYNNWELIISSETTKKISKNLKILK